MADSLKVTPVVRIQVKVVPGAAGSTVAGWLGDRLKLRIGAPPEKGKANAAVEALIADSLGLQTSAVRIVAGHRSARKTIEIIGIDEMIIEKRFGKSKK